MKKKILIFHPALAPYRIDFFNAIHEKYDIHVVFLNKNVKSFSFNQSLLSDQLKCSFQYLENGFDINSWTFRKKIFSIVSHFRPDIIVTHEFAFQTFQIILLKVFKKYFKHFIWTADNFEMVKNANLFSRFRKRICLKLVDGISVYTKDVKQIYSDKYKLHDNFIGIFPNVQNEKNRYEKLNSIKNLYDDLNEKYKNQHVVLYVGRLDPEKNVSLLIDAFVYAKQLGFEGVLIIIGEGTQKQNLISLSNGKNNEIFFTGKIEGDLLQKYYLVADLFVLPSTFEPFGAVVNEALLTGLPVFCTNKAGAKDLIVHYENGLIFDPDLGLENLGTLISNFFRDKKVRNKSELRTSLMEKSFHDYLMNWIPEIVTN